MCSSSRGLLSWCDLKNREADQGVGSPQAIANLCEFLREIVKGQVVREFPSGPVVRTLQVHY